MAFLSNLESAHWVQAEPRLLRLLGWVVTTDNSPVQGVRLRCPTRSFAGYHGIRRPDVGRVHATQPQAAFSGFSILAATTAADLPGILEAQDTSLAWHSFATVTASGVTVTALPPAVPVESEEVTPADPVPANHRPVLFIGHDFAFAGAQMILLRLMRWLRDRTSLRMEILIAMPRAAADHATESEKHLLAGYGEIGPLHFISDLSQAPENLGRIRRGDYRLIYANTGTLGWLLPSLQPFACPVISSVYELGFWLKRRTGSAVFQRQAAQTDVFLAGGRAVRDLLVHDFSVPAGKIEVVYACTSTERARTFRKQHTREEIRKVLGLPPEAFVVQACGTFDWRKGAELFVPICVALRRHLAGQDFRVIWIGDPGSPLIREQFLHDIETAGLVEHVRLVEPQQNLAWWLLAADCFALPSREYPFPMVMLEAGVLGLPVVGFQGSGGVEEFVDGEAGLVVPYLDVDAFAAALASLGRDREKCRRFGRAAEVRASGNFDEDISFARIATLIQELSSESHAPVAAGHG